MTRIDRDSIDGKLMEEYPNINIYEPHKPIDIGVPGSMALFASRWMCE